MAYKLLLRGFYLYYYSNYIILVAAGTFSSRFHFSLYRAFFLAELITQAVQMLFMLPALLSRASNSMMIMDWTGRDVWSDGGHAHALKKKKAFLFLDIAAAAAAAVRNSAGFFSSLPYI